MVFLWAIPLAILILLFTLNTFLRGGRKEQIEHTLTLLIYLCIGMAFLLSGWKWGLLALASPFVLPLLLRGPILLIAGQLVDDPDRRSTPHAEDGLDRMLLESRNFWGEEAVRERKQRDAEEASHRERCVDVATHLRGVEAALRETRADQDDLRALYDDIKYFHPPALREKVFSNIALIKFYLEATHRQANTDGVNRVFNSEAEQIKFRLWTNKPSGATPR